MSSPKDIRLRLIRMMKKDLKFMWTVRNHPDVRKFLINDDSITYDQHLEWYKKSYTHNPNYVIWIIRVQIENEWVNIGFCDVKHSNEGVELGWKILPEYHGKGYGSQAIKILTNKIKLENEGKRIFLTVLSSNEKATHLYEKYGYTIDEVVPVVLIQRPNGDKLKLYTLKYQDR